MKWFNIFRPPPIYCCRQRIFFGDILHYQLCTIWSRNIQNTFHGLHCKNMHVSLSSSVRVRVWRVRPRTPKFSSCQSGIAWLQQILCDMWSLSISLYHADHCINVLLFDAQLKLNLHCMPLHDSFYSYIWLSCLRCESRSSFKEVDFESCENAISF